jgi:hypothetical protein
MHSAFLVGLLCIVLLAGVGCAGIGATAASDSPTPRPAPTPNPTPTPSPTPVAGIFTPTPGNMTTPRNGHAATLLDDGTVLVVGGFSNLNNCPVPITCYLKSSERFNPASGTFAAGPDMTEPRLQPVLARLQNGQVLVVGGSTLTALLATTELFDPVTGAFEASGSMAHNRNRGTATLLRNGKVLVAGGVGTDAAGLSSWSGGELYDPATRTFSSVGSMSAARTDHTATLLNDGKVLIAGGTTICLAGVCGLPLNAISPAELYDPDTNLFSGAGNMATGRFQHTATLLPSGLVVVAGGKTVNAGNTAYEPTDSIEIYDPATGTFSPGGKLAAARARHTATLLSNGQILFAGGMVTAAVILKSAELYTPATHTSTAVSDMTVERLLHTATLLPDGQVVMIGGGSNTATLDSAEIFK